MQPILYLLSTLEYWAGVGTVVFIGLAGFLVFLVFQAEPAATTPAEPHPGWLRTSDELGGELSRAAAARKAKADARRYGKPHSRAEGHDLRGGH